MENQVRQWVGECLRKKKLKKSWADRIIARARQDGNILFSYYCRHCQHFHITKMNPETYKEKMSA